MAGVHKWLRTYQIPYVLANGACFIIKDNSSDFLSTASFSMAVAEEFVPGVVTSVILTPFSLFILYQVAVLTQYSLQLLIISSIGEFALLLINLKMLHRAMPLFEKFLNKMVVGEQADKVS